MAPVAAHGLANVKAEKASARKELRASVQFTQLVSYTSCTLEEIRAAGGEQAPQWFQFYMSKDDGIQSGYFGDGETQWCQSDCFNGGCTVGGNRETDRRNGFYLSIGYTNW